MPELDAALRELGTHLAWPETPDLVLERLERPARRRWVLAVALVVILALATAFAVPPARTAILDWLGLRHVSIVQVDTLPPVSPRGSLDLGREVSRSPDWVLVPKSKPDHAYMNGDTVTLLWGNPSEPRLLLTELRGTAFIDKAVQPGTNIERVRVGRDPGAWIPEPHVVVIRDPSGAIHDTEPRLAGKTLLWQHGELTLRLEGDLSQADALRIARSAH
jgi:hypothetical protein